MQTLLMSSSTIWFDSFAMGFCTMDSEKNRKKKGSVTESLPSSNAPNNAQAQHSLQLGLPILGAGFLGLPTQPLHSLDPSPLHPIYPSISPILINNNLHQQHQLFPHNATPHMPSSQLFQHNTTPSMSLSQRSHSPIQTTSTNHSSNKRNERGSSEDQQNDDSDDQRPVNKSRTHRNKHSTRSTSATWKNYEKKLILTESEYRGLKIPAYDISQVMSHFNWEWSGLSII